jgi:hypothetical protein
MLKAGAPCPYGVCDGTGFVDDEASRTVARAAAGPSASRSGGRRRCLQ